VRLWFDEDLSPTLVQVAHEHGLEATCNRDRGVLGHTDVLLRQLVQSQGYVLVTDNASDLKPMYRRGELHPGMIVIPEGMVAPANSSSCGR
jgi:predicted nuclease of predicted toxin-antitoxin system